MKKCTLVAILTILLSAGIAHAQFDSLNMRFVGNWPFGPANAVACDSARSLVFLGSGGGVYVLDVSDSTNPVSLSDAIRTRGVVEGLFYDTSSQRLYIADGEAGMEIWDVSTPAQPAKLWTHNTPGYANRVYVSYPYAYVADGLAGVRVIRLYSTSHPREMGYFEARDYAYDVSVQDSYAYVCDGDSGVWIVDVTNPSNPFEVARYQSPDAAKGLYIKDSLAYVAVSDSGLSILDISTPSAPEVIGRHYLWLFILGFYSAEDVYGSDSLAYLIGNKEFGDELWMVDVSDPSSPQTIKVLGSVTPDIGEVCAWGNNLYIAESKGLRVLDVFGSSEPPDLGFYDTPGYANKVHVLGSYAYVVTCGGWVTEGLYVIDLSDRLNPQEAGFYEIRDAYEIDVQHPYVYLVRGHEGLSVIDVSNPASPVEVGTYDTLDNDYYDIQVSGFYGYVLDSYFGIRVFDVSLPENPFEIGFCETPGFPSYLHMSGSYVYVADCFGLSIVDVSEPASPQLVGYLDMESDAVYDVCTWGSYAYVVDRDYGLRVIDVSTPNSPQEVWSNDTSAAYGIGINVSYPYAYVHESSTVRMFDISIPDHPREVGFCDPAGWFWGIHSEGSYIYLASFDTGLRIYQNLLWESVDESPITQARPIHLTTTLNRLSYDVSGQAQLTLYSADGRRILEETIEGKGTWVAPIGFPSGVYFARVEGESAAYTGKVVLVR